MQAGRHRRGRRGTEREEDGLEEPEASMEASMGLRSETENWRELGREEAAARSWRHIP